MAIYQHALGEQLQQTLPLTVSFDDATIYAWLRKPDGSRLRLGVEADDESHVVTYTTQHRDLDQAGHYTWQVVLEYGDSSTLHTDPVPFDVWPSSAPGGP